jgi:hypothetical protein
MGALMPRWSGVAGCCGHSSSAAFGRTQPKSGASEPAQQFAALHFHSSSCNHVLAVLLWDIEVIALKRSTRNVEGVGERQEFVVRHIAHHVAPLAALEPPARLVDQDRHGAECATWRCAATLMR